MFWLCFEGWSPVEHTQHRLSWVLIWVRLNMVATLIHIIVIKLLSEHAAWQLLWWFPFHPFCVLPLIVTRQYIKAQANIPKWALEGIFFNYALQLCLMPGVWFRETLLLAKLTLSAAQLGPGFRMCCLDFQKCLSLLFSFVKNGLTCAHWLILFALYSGLECIAGQSFI